MSEQVIEPDRINRSELVKRGRRPEYFTITYNTLEGTIAVVAGAIATDWDAPAERKRVRPALKDSYEARTAGAHARVEYGRSRGAGRQQ